jgi:tryptophan-rich sensory protein
MSTDRRTDVALFFAPLLAGLLGSIPTARSVRTWYRRLDRPSWTPPDRAFGPVWTTLYLLMGAAAVIVHRAGAAPSTTATPAAVDTGATRRVTDGSRARPALRLFAAQLALNVAWSFIFFGARAVRAAGIEVVVLWAAIAATVRAFWRVRPVAALLLLPYLAWTSLATALNLEIWRRNS